MSDAAVKDVIERELTAARRRSLALLEPLREDDLRRQHSPLMSPLVWDLAHIGNYEDQWLLRALGAAATRDGLDDVYDAFRHPRRDRPSLPLLAPAEATAYVAMVRDRVLDVLTRTELDESHPLLSRAFVYGMVVQHEHQHDETMLATLQLMEGDGYRPVAPPPPSVAGRVLPADVLVDGGPFVMGTDVEPWAYDNERPAHEVDVAPFRIDTVPVTNRAFAAFVADGGYREPRWWTAEGRAWVAEAGLVAPAFWEDDGAGGHVRNRFGWREEVPADEPVQHVCWYEADAYARWAGRRLPTEAEWEKAATWARAGRPTRYPWGDEPVTPARANLDGVAYRPAVVGAYPDGASAWGAEQMIGDVWEWTASDFEPYPGTRAHPYREYSEVFYGPGYKVLRGGSWATASVAIRGTFRNWDLPIRRQIFSGFRCAVDA
ncbi:MAG TPA: ergothioneine biosynthesis protein EgtB [Acidimicrobiales bacterium]|nr:ergothioneine biosynthesis protein EgtB [Acidimicrobiales bacterium]